MGVITKGEAFELDRPRQVTFIVTGACDSAQNGYLETTLDFLDVGRSQVIGRTRLNSVKPIPMGNGATLFLPKGKYSFTAKVRPDSGGTLANPNIDTATVRINFSPEQPFDIGAASSYGSHESWLLASVGTELPVQAAATIRERLPAGAYLTGSLAILNTGNNTAVATPHALLRGQSLYPLQIEATPIYLRPGIIYRMDCVMIYGGEITSTQSVSVRP
jgi:hypothetical protein